MFACSLVGAVRAVEAHADALHAMRVLRGREAVERRTAAVRATCSDVAALLGAAAPFPPADLDVGDRREAVERAVVRVLRSVYDDGVARLDDLDDATAATAERSPRLAVSGGTVLVPLAREGRRAHNWASVVAVLLEKLDGVLDAFRSVAGRLRSTAGPARTTCDSAVAMLETLADVLRRARGEHRLVTHEVDGPWDDQAEFAEWTITRLDGDNHA